MRKLSPLAAVRPMSSTKLAVVLIAAFMTLLVVFVSVYEPDRRDSSWRIPTREALSLLEADPDLNILAACDKVAQAESLYPSAESDRVSHLEEELDIVLAGSLCGSIRRKADLMGSPAVSKEVGSPEKYLLTERLGMLLE